MTAERPTLDIARDLRKLSVDDDNIALVVEAADRLEEFAKQRMHACGHAFIGNVGEFTCRMYVGHVGDHWDYVADVKWTDASCTCVEVEGDEFCPIHCCTDHSNLCGVAETKRDACCDDCPEFAKS